MFICKLQLRMGAAETQQRISNNNEQTPWQSTTGGRIDRSRQQPQQTATKHDVPSRQESLRSRENEWGEKKCTQRCLPSPNSRRRGANTATTKQQQFQRKCTEHQLDGCNL
mmetsp:Transcript_27565/g.44220  ORF Transcript_27565/g.44220 Transcript_27565/m.44220 type:complete len:111 (+) Transcript_27565:34-366(+)